MTPREQDRVAVDKERSDHETLDRWLRRIGEDQRHIDLTPVQARPQTLHVIIDQPDRHVGLTGPQPADRARHEGRQRGREASQSDPGHPPSRQLVQVSFSGFQPGDSGPTVLGQHPTRRRSAAPGGTVVRPAAARPVVPARQRAG